MKPLTQLIVLMSGMVALVAVGIGGMVAIEWLRPEGHNAQLNTEIVGVITIVAVQILGYIKSVINGQQIEQVKNKIDNAPAEVKQAADDAKATIKHEAATAAVVAKDQIEYAAAVAAQKLMDTATASQLAQKGN